MANIAESRRLLGATPEMSLKELSNCYKALMKQHHPDRFQDEAGRAAAEAMSQQIIAAYKLLESMHPETHAARMQELEAALVSQVLDWRYEREMLTLTFGNGSSYAFHGIGRATYNKFVASDGAARYVRRNLVGRFTHRKVSGPAAG